LANKDSVLNPCWPKYLRPSEIILERVPFKNVWTVFVIKEKSYFMLKLEYFCIKKKQVVGKQGNQSGAMMVGIEKFPNFLS